MSTRPSFTLAAGFTARRPPVNLASWQAKALYQQPDDAPFVSFRAWLIVAAVCAVATFAILALLP